MFHSDRWADAFVSVCAGHAGEGLDILKAFAPVLAPLPGRIAGLADALALERILRASLEAAGVGAGGEGAEYAVRFVALLVRKGRFRQLDQAVRAVEQRVDAQNGIFTVDIESAGPVDGDLREAIKAALMRKYGAREIRLVSRIVPELLGGCRLRFGDELVDASVQGRLERMAAYFHAADAFGAASADGGFA
jgi:F-type H+-transporting ATPase subunit delta